jgi:hypothetical protein
LKIGGGPEGAGVKLDIAEDDIPFLVRALEHYVAYLEATKRSDERYVALAEELTRKEPAAEVTRPKKSAKRRASTIQMFHWNHEIRLQ